MKTLVIIYYNKCPLFEQTEIMYLIGLAIVSNNRGVATKKLVLYFHFESFVKAIKYWMRQSCDILQMFSVDNNKIALTICLSCRTT